MIRWSASATVKMISMAQNIPKYALNILMKMTFYFILSSEIMENISEIKVVSIYSEMLWYHFTVD